MTTEQFKILFEMYFDAIRKYLYYRSGDSVLSSDLAQDTFMRIWEKQLDIIPGKDTALLYKIAGDLFVSQFRKERHSINMLKELSFEKTGTSPEEVLLCKELHEQFEKALISLPENHRIVFLMSRVEGLTYREIAERLSLSVKSVEQRMNGALGRLKKKLKT